MKFERSQLGGGVLDGVAGGVELVDHGFHGPLNSNAAWSPGFHDAGIYPALSDGSLHPSHGWPVSRRPPLPEMITRAQQTR
jgi:hypothetical protein